MNSSARAVALVAAILSLSAVILAAMGSHLIDMKEMQSLCLNVELVETGAAAEGGIACQLLFTSVEMGHVVNYFWGRGFLWQYLFPRYFRTQGADGNTCWWFSDDGGLAPGSPGILP